MTFFQNIFKKIYDLITQQRIISGTSPDNNKLPSPLTRNGSRVGCALLLQNQKHLISIIYGFVLADTS